MTGVHSLRGRGFVSAALLGLSVAFGPNPIYAATSGQADWHTKLPAFLTSGTGWHLLGGPFKGKDFVPVPGKDGPIGNDPAYPMTCNTCGGVPTKRIGNDKSPLLQSWAAEAMRKSNAALLAGGVAFDPSARCWPAGVPNVVSFAIEPIWFLPAKDSIVMLYQRGPVIRHVYMNQKHSKTVKPSWYGESVGHIEGDTLVVDTVGFNTKSFVDLFGTRHTAKLHVVERYRTVDDGKGRKRLEAIVEVDDPGAFTKPWYGMKLHGPSKDFYEESVCAENNDDKFHQGLAPLPIAEKPDF